MSGEINNLTTNMQKDYTKIDEEFDKKFVTYFGDIPVIDCDTVRIKDIKNFLHTQISLSEQSLLERIMMKFQTNNYDVLDTFNYLKDLLTSLKHPKI